MALTLFGDPVANDTVGWMSEPNTRGTFSILWTCLVTLFLCVWSALHLNIPLKTSISSKILRRTQWLLLALLAPELVAFTAYQQRREAYKTADVVRKAQGHAPLRSPFERLVRTILRRPDEHRTQSPDEEMATLQGVKSRKPSHPFTLVHGFYVVMGGFVIDTSDDGEGFLHNWHHNPVIAPCGVRIIGQYAPHLLPNLSREQIQDKSKADPLIKTLVCLQATWFCVQCIGRIASSLPLGLIELNTFAHALCTLLIYLLWWDKPVEIEQPTTFGSRDAHPLLALMAFTRGGTGKPWRDNASSYCVPTFTFNKCSSHSPNASTNPDLCTEPAESIQTDGNIVLINKSRHRGISFSFDPEFLPDRAEEDPTITLGPREDRLWQLASQGYATVCDSLPNLGNAPIVRWSSSGTCFSDDGFWYDYETDPVFIKASRDWPTFQLAMYRPTDSFAISFTVAGLFYGGLHALAWNAPFASSAQQLLWRGCSVALGASGPVVLVAATYRYFRYIRGRSLWSNRWKRRRDFKSLLLYILDIYILKGVHIAFMVFYLFLRVFIVVESFLSLSHMPKAVYTCMEWSNYLPNFS